MAIQFLQDAPATTMPTSDQSTSFYIDFDLSSHTARITLWLSAGGGGMCDTEILNVDSEETELWQHHDFSNSEEFTPILSDFLSRLNAIPSPQGVAAELTYHGRRTPLSLPGGSISLTSLLQSFAVSASFPHQA